MKWDNNWSKGMKAAYNSARKEFLATGTKEAVRDKSSGIKKMLKREEARDDPPEARIDNLTTALEKWQAKLDDM